LTWIPVAAIALDKTEININGVITLICESTVTWIMASQMKHAECGTAEITLADMYLDIGN